MTSPGLLVLVVGPPLAGVDGVAEALRRRLPGHVVTGTDGLDPRRAPDAVVAVVSAAAPMTGSDWELIESAAVRTELVIGAVSKIDAHRNWRDVLEADRALAAGWAPRRQPMPWVGVAAAPDLGEPNVDALVALLHDRLGDPDLGRRNQLRVNEFRMRSARALDRRANVSSRADAVELRGVLQRVRLRLLRFVRDRSAAMRAELRDAAAEVPAGGCGRFEAVVRLGAGRFLAELDEEITRAVDAAAAELAMDERAVVGLGSAGAQDAPDLGGARSSSRRLEGRLMAVLGAGFGLGIALASSRLLAGLAPGLSIAGWVAGGVIGLVLVVWVVRARRVLHDRALLDRWVAEVAATLRWHGEAVVAERLLAVESAYSRANPPKRRI